MRKILTFSSALLMTHILWAQDTNQCDLHKLIDQKAYAQISACVEAGSDPNVKDSLNQSLLTIYKSFTLSRNALKDPDIKRMVLILIDKGIDVNYRRKEDENTPFENLLSVGEHSETWDVIFAMLKAGADPNTKTQQYYDFKKSITPLLWAIKHHQHSAFDWLVAQGVSLTHSPDKLLSPLAHAVHYGNQHAFNVLRQKGGEFTDKETPFTLWKMAIDAQDRNKAISLLQQANIRPNWAEVGIKEQRELFNAIYQNLDENTLSVMQFLAFKLPDNQQSLWLTLFNADQLYWQLHTSQHPQQVAITQLLIAQGEPVDFTDTNKNNSLLQIMTAFSSLSLTIAEELIRAGAPIQHQDADGDTPLHEIAYALEKLHTQKLMLIAQGTTLTNRYAPENDINEIMGLALKNNPKVDRLAENKKQQDKLRQFYQLLLRYGADENLANKQGKTPKRLMTKLQASL